jgi:hypothetical protein
MRVCTEFGVGGGAWAEARLDREKASTIDDSNTPETFAVPRFMEGSLPRLISAALKSSE